MRSSLSEWLNSIQYKLLLWVQQFGKKADYVVNTVSVVVAVQIGRAHV